MKINSKCLVITSKKGFELIGSEKIFVKNILDKI